VNFRIKICGITSVDDARAAVEAGADAIGLNFYEKSPRCVTIEKSKEIGSALHSVEIARIGVFVNKSAAEMEFIMLLGRLTGLQLHGDETPDDVASFERSTDCTLIRVRRLGDRGVAAIAEDLAACMRAGRLPDAILVDALTPGRYGGTGDTVSWVGLADYKRWLGDTPLILAGGLTPANVAEAIRIVRPHAVDVASGVESSPGKKDVAKMRDFVAVAREAFAAL
jgi:phosphoribosylanthranilate isomerase